MNLLKFIFAVLTILQVCSTQLPPPPPPGPTAWIVYLIDQVQVVKGQYNYLFRGNLPLLTNTEFNYNGLIQVLNEKVTLPKNIFVVDIALEWTFWPDNSSWIPTESAFFQSNPHLGKFIHWPLYGDLNDPNDEPIKYLEYFANILPTWQLDQLPQKMQEINTALHTQYNDTSYVFYFHCHTGVDRTAEFAISYELTYLNQSFQAAVNFSDALCDKVNGRPVMPFQAFAAEWYCYYLYFALGKDDLYCHLPNK